MPRVLVVDDDPRVALALQLMLAEDTSTDVELVATAALARIERGETFHVIFFDVAMPEMSALDFFVRVRERAPAMAARIVFITGAVASPQTERALESLPNLCIQQPFDAAGLNDLVYRRSDSTPPPPSGMVA